MESAILPEQTQQLEDVRDIGVAIAVDVATIVCSEGTDRLQDVVHIASAIAVEVAIAATDALDDAIEGILGEIVPDPLRPLGVSRGSIMTTPLTSIVLVTVATIASGPGVSSDVATHVHDLGSRTRTVETHEMIVLGVGGLWIV